VHLSHLQKKTPKWKTTLSGGDSCSGDLPKLFCSVIEDGKRLKMFCSFHGSESCMISNQEIDNGLFYFPLDNIMEGFLLDSGVGLKLSRWRLFQIFSLEHLDWGQDCRSVYLVMMEVHVGETIYEQ
jgi:hypothetical protein